MYDCCKTEIETYEMIYVCMYEYVIKVIDFKNAR